MRVQEVKTPEEIKKGLECRFCHECPYDNNEFETVEECARQARKDAIAYIQQHESTVSQVSKALCGKENATLDKILQAVGQLKSRLAQVERERDALKHDMRQCQSAVCNACKHHYRPNPDVRFYECALLGRFSDFLNSDDDRPFICGKFEWRGVCEENTKGRRRSYEHP